MFEHHELKERALNLRPTNIAVCAFALAALLSGGVTTAQTAKAPSSAAAATQTMEVTGQHTAASPTKNSFSSSTMASK
jgi:hypothetical protein